MEHNDEEQEGVEFVVPPLPDSDSEEPVPKRLSRRRINKEHRDREERWFKSNVASLQELIKSGALRSENLVLYGLWWQLERWLKDLIRLEMMSAYGLAWISQVRKPELRRTDQRSENAYMSSSDDTNPVAYCDLGDIENIARDQWQLLSYALLPEPRWTGRLSELKPVRHRVGHCREPHVDDIARVQQTLRDLTPGALRALSSYADERWLSPEDGVLYKKWDRRSNVSDGILRHIAEHYDITCSVKMSKRPWSAHDALLHLHWRSRKWPLDLAKVDGFLQMMTDTECGPLIHLNIAGPYTAEAVFALHDRADAETAVELWIGEIATLHSPFASKDVLESPQRRSLDYRVRIEDYFAYAADAGRGEPFSIVGD